jgi:hypothetical protein
MDPLKLTKIPVNLRNIDRANIFSLAHQTPAGATPYNPNHHIAEPFMLRPLYLAQADKLHSSLIELSNKITLGISQSKQKKFYEFSVFLIFRHLALTRPQRCSLDILI